MPGVPSLHEIIAAAAGVSDWVQVEQERWRPEYTAPLAYKGMLESASIAISKSSARFVPKPTPAGVLPTPYTHEIYILELSEPKTRYTTNYLLDESGKVTYYFPSTKIRDLFEKVHAEITYNSYMSMTT